jgi:hypothetical protein
MEGNMSDIVKKSQQHLTDMNESYWEHLYFAAIFAVQLFGASLAVIIHALIPAFFQYTGSKTIKSLHETLQKRADQESHV